MCNHPYLYNYSAVHTKATLKAQDFLEADPYHDTSQMPLGTFKAQEPHIGRIVSVKRIAGAQVLGEIYSVVIDHGGKMPYWEGQVVYVFVWIGLLVCLYVCVCMCKLFICVCVTIHHVVSRQSYGVIPPGINPKNNKPHANRLYSISSTRYGDDMQGTTATLCVRRATFFDPALGRDDPTKNGVCSNFLCNARPGDEVRLTGPTGRVMLMPASPSADIIMVATGTGIAPYRAFIRRLFVEDTPAAKAFKGLAWLFLGVPTTQSLLYDEDWQGIRASHPQQFRLDYALSREQTNKKGDKMYIQDKVGLLCLSVRCMLCVLRYVVQNACVECM